MCGHTRRPVSPSSVARVEDTLARVEDIPGQRGGILHISAEAVLLFGQECPPPWPGCPPPWPQMKVTLSSWYGHTYIMALGILHFIQINASSELTTENEAQVFILFVQHFASSLG